MQEDREPQFKKHQSNYEKTNDQILFNNLSWKKGLEVSEEMNDKLRCQLKQAIHAITWQTQAQGQNWQDNPNCWDSSVRNNSTDNQGPTLQQQRQNYNRLIMNMDHYALPSDQNRNTSGPAGTLVAPIRNKHESHSQAGYYRSIDPSVFPEGGIYAGMCTGSHA